jgi:hypothetical protein
MKLHTSKRFLIKKVTISLIIITIIINTRRVTISLIITIIINTRRITKNMFNTNVGFQYCSYVFV